MQWLRRGVTCFLITFGLGWSTCRFSLHACATQPNYDMHVPICPSIYWRPKPNSNEDACMIPQQQWSVSNNALRQRRIRENVLVAELQNWNGCLI